MSEVFVPKAYQGPIIRMALSKGKMNWFVGMGGGKTVCALSTLIFTGMTTGVSRALVVMPKAVLDKRVWRNEIDKWLHTKHLRIAHVEGSEREKLRALATPADLYAVSYTSLRWLCDLYKHRWPFDFVIADESDTIRNASTGMFKAFRKVQDKIYKYLNLTGSPTPNGVANLWTQTYMVDGGQRLGRTAMEFNERYFHKKYSGYGYIANSNASELILHSIADITVSILAKEQLDLTPIEYIDVDVDLSSSELQQYEVLRKQAVLELQQGGVITSVNAAAATTKLRQFCSGAVYAEDVETKLRCTHVVSMAKLIALKELTAKINEPVIVGYTYQHEAERIKAHIPEAVLMRDVVDLEAVWATGSIKVLLIQAASGSRGLNLQHGGGTVIWYTPTWALDVYEQLNARVWRTGQAKGVNIYRLLCNNTIERDMVDRMSSKISVQDAVNRYFKLGE
jgi:SNF2 family DNA or RNA helicase